MDFKNTTNLFVHPRTVNLQYLIRSDKITCQIESSRPDYTPCTCTDTIHCGFGVSHLNPVYHPGCSFSSRKWRSLLVTKITNRSSRFIRRWNIHPQAMKARKYVVSDIQGVTASLPHNARNACIMSELLKVSRIVRRRAAQHGKNLCAGYAAHWDKDRLKPVTMILYSLTASML